MKLKVALFLLSLFLLFHLSLHLFITKYDDSLVLEGIVPHSWIDQGYNQNLLVSSRNSKSVTTGYM